MSVADYLDAQQSNLGQLKRLPHYIRLLEPIDALYRQATDLLPPTSQVVWAGDRSPRGGAGGQGRDRLGGARSSTTRDRSWLASAVPK